jgi:SAM-dependent methyltransferase
MSERVAGDVDYARHGTGYAVRRQTDPRIAAYVQAALGDARTVLNVGAGAGSYEPADRVVVAVEPSKTMRAQRPRAAVPAIDAAAESLPFDDDAFDASMAIFTVHQWQDLAAGLRELRRVTRGPVVIFAGDGEAYRRFWLADYVPDVVEVEGRRFPPIAAITAALGGRSEVSAVPVPRDCVDGFAEAFYARPEMFLEPNVRAAQSSWSFVDATKIETGLARLRADLASGAWDARHGALRRMPAYEGAMRLIVARR